MKLYYTIRFCHVVLLYYMDFQAGAQPEFVWGVRVVARENFLKWCNLVRFDVYFDPILSLNFFEKYHFLYKK